MPCYSRWDSYLEKGTHEYLRAEQEVRAKLKAVKHIINYYYHAARMSLPSGNELFPYGGIDAHADSPEEKGLMEIIAHHFTCDGISFMTLSDCMTLMRDDDIEDMPYLRVMFACSDDLRNRPKVFDILREYD